EQRLPIEMQHVEHDIADRDPPGTPGDLGAARQMHALLQQAEARPPVRAQGYKFPVDDSRASPESLPHLPQLGKRGRDVPVRPAQSANAATVDIDHSPDAIPLDLIGPPLVTGRQRSGCREHGRDPPRKWLEAVTDGVHAVNHPVLPAGREQDVAATSLRPVQYDHDLGVGPLLEFVIAVIPDAHAPAAVLAIRDVTIAASVLKRMVFGMHGEMIRGRVFRDTLRQRPRHQDAVVLKPEVPVQRPRVVLLDDKHRPVVFPRRAGALRLHRLRGPGRITLRPVGTERAVLSHGGLLRGAAQAWPSWANTREHAGYARRLPARIGSTARIGSRSSTATAAQASPPTGHPTCAGWRRRRSDWRGFRAACRCRPTWRAFGRTPRLCSARSARRARPWPAR